MVEPNAYAYMKTDRAQEIFSQFKGKILVPDRIWWDTAHVIALWSSEDTLSNIFYSIRLNVPEQMREKAEKALVLWLNTTWGLLTVLINRQETRGRWTRLKMAQWRLLPVLDVSSLNEKTLERLTKVFDAYANKIPKRIPEQFDLKKLDDVRLGIDVGFLKALNPELDGEVAKKTLLELYGHINIALKQWVG